MPPEPRDHRISVKEATEYTRRHREASGKGAALGGMFGRKAIEELLQQKGCEGIRIYYGRDVGGQPALVLVGVTATDADMTEGTILQKAYPCPPICGSSSALNS